MTGKNPSPNTRVRDAGTGQYVPSKEADRRPKTTVREVIPPKPNNPKK
jgi:hypothetical protein